MFFLKEMEHEVTLAPRYFASGIKDLIRYALYRQLEGVCYGKHGYIVAIVGIRNVSRGVLRDNSGALLATQGTMALAGTATYRVRFQAILFRPFRGEVLDATITAVNKMGFFAETGPVKIFVSSHQIGTHFAFDPNALPAAFVSADQLDFLAPGTRVRLRIVGTRVDATEIFGIGTIKEEHLGLL